VLHIFRSYFREPHKAQKRYFPILAVLSVTCGNADTHCVCDLRLAYCVVTSEYLALEHDYGHLGSVKYGQVEFSSD